MGKNTGIQTEVELWGRILAYRQKLNCGGGYWHTDISWIVGEVTGIQTHLIIIKDAVTNCAPKDSVMCTWTWILGSTTSRSSDFVKILRFNSGCKWHGFIWFLKECSYFMLHLVITLQKCHLLFLKKNKNLPVAVFHTWLSILKHWAEDSHWNTWDNLNQNGDGVIC